MLVTTIPALEDQYEMIVYTPSGKAHLRQGYGVQGEVWLYILNIVVQFYHFISNGIFKDSETFLP